jgi:AcrR family transcriptional regulator
VVERPSRADKAHARRDAILEAAIAEFVAKGFAATRVEDIAARAGVAKGTVYLNFADKEALFEGAVKARMLPIAARVAASLDAETATAARQAVEAFLEQALTLLSQPATGDVVRLVVSESIRFPALTAFYRREVIAPLAARLRPVLARAAMAGELTTPVSADYPPLVVAPMLLAVIAGGMLSELGIGDVRGMLRVHLDGLFGGARAPGPILP